MSAHSLVVISCDLVIAGTNCQDQQGVSVHAAEVRQEGGLPQPADL